MRRKTYFYNFFWKFLFLVKENKAEGITIRPPYAEVGLEYPVKQLLHTSYKT